MDTTSELHATVKQGSTSHPPFTLTLLMTLMERDLRVSVVLEGCACKWRGETRTVKVVVSSIGPSDRSQLDSARVGRSMSCGTSHGYHQPCVPLSLLSSVARSRQSLFHV